MFYIFGLVSVMKKESHQKKPTNFPLIFSVELYLFYIHSKKNECWDQKNYEELIPENK